MTSLRLPLAATAALLALAASAQAAPHGQAAFIADYDLDGDGKVTAAEFRTVRNQRFAATDLDKDGGLTEAEYVGEYQARLETQLAASDETAERKAEERVRQIRQAHVRFGVLDKNKDGRIDAEEFAASGLRAFAEQDGDKDGTITAGEQQARVTASR
ncbi:MAG: hypothetical protein ACK41C_17225 [Phenylobacterium sp.]|jgi:hypothetical protein|uniref:hypothetical protein n=1 Tax=Phenylobacterium sp. TaxID=1871053 RepID=UPI00391AF081